MDRGEGALLTDLGGFGFATTAPVQRPMLAVVVWAFGAEGHADHRLVPVHVSQALPKCSGGTYVHEFQG